MINDGLKKIGTKEGSKVLDSNSHKSMQKLSDEDSMEPEAFFDWKMKKKFFSIEKRRHSNKLKHSHDSTETKKRKRTSAESPATIHRDLIKVIEDKLKEGSLEEEEERVKKAILAEDNDEGCWTKEIERDWSKDNFNLELVETFNISTIRAHYQLKQRDNFLEKCLRGLNFSRK